jgi:hypothetical protein
MRRTDDHGSELETLPYALPVNLVGKVGETDKTHEFLANHWRPGGVLGGNQRGIGGVGVAILGKGEAVAVAAGIVGHLSEGARTEEMDEETERLSTSPVVDQARRQRRAWLFDSVCVRWLNNTTAVSIILRNT